MVSSAALSSSFVSEGVQEAIATWRAVCWVSGSRTLAEVVLRRDLRTGMLWSVAARRSIVLEGSVGMGVEIVVAMIGNRRDWRDWRGEVSFG